MISLILASVLGAGPVPPVVCTPGDFWYQDSTRIWFACPVRNQWHVTGSSPGLGRGDPLGVPQGLIDHIPAPPPPGISPVSFTYLQSDLTWAAVTGGSGAPTTSQYLTGVDDAALPNDIFPLGDDRIPVSSGGSPGAVWTSVPNAFASTFSALGYRQATNAFAVVPIPQGVETEVDFGANGNTQASVVVAGLTYVASTSMIVCAPTMTATADRVDGAEDAVIEGIDASPYAIVAGTGFSVMAGCAQGVCIGKFKVHCVVS